MESPAYNSPPKRSPLGQLLYTLRQRQRTEEGKAWLQSDLATEMDLFLEADERPIHPTTVSKVETGQQKPSARWLEVALKALNASYPEYQEAMELAGYLPRMPLPKDEEIHGMRRKVKDILAARPYPMYLADCALRMIEW